MYFEYDVVVLNSNAVAKIVDELGRRSLSKWELVQVPAVGMNRSLFIFKRPFTPEEAETPVEVEEAVEEIVEEETDKSSFLSAIVKGK